MSKQRGNGEGTIKRLENGRFLGQIMVGYKYVKGVKRRDVRTGTFDTRQQVQEFFRECSSQPQTINKKMTLGEWADKWYEKLADEVAKNKLEESTYVGYKYTLRLIKNQWGDRPLADISVAEIEDGIDQILKPIPRLDDFGKPVVDEDDKPMFDYVRYEFGIYKKIKAMLGQIYNRAEAAKIIMHVDNPMYLVNDLVNPDRGKKLKDSWTLEEAQRIINAAPLFKDTRDYRYYCALVVGMAAGCRSQEIIPLMDTDIEPDGSAIVIDKAVKMKAKAKTYIGETKTPMSDRITYLPEYAWEFARWLRQNATHGFILYGVRSNKHIHTTTYRDGIMRVVAQIDGVRKLLPHEGQRHTQASIGIFDAEIDEREMMERTGHADVKTFRRYTHAHAKEKKNVAAKFNAVIKGQKNDTQLFNKDSIKKDSD